MTTGILTYGLLGTVGLIPSVDIVARWVGVMTLLYATSWYLGGGHYFLMSRPGAQANAAKSTTGLRGAAHFGSVMGVGFFTEMSTPFVWVGTILSPGYGVVWGMLYGGGFAIGPLPVRLA